MSVDFATATTACYDSRPAERNRRVVSVPVRLWTAVETKARNDDVLVELGELALAEVELKQIALDFVVVGGAQRKAARPLALKHERRVVVIDVDTLTAFCGARSAHQRDDN